MNTLQRESAIKRLQEMVERLPDGGFDRVAVNAAIRDMMLQIPGAVKFGGGALLAEYSGVDGCKTINTCFGCPLDEVQRLVEADKAAKLQRAAKGDDSIESAQETAGKRLP